MAIGTAGVWLAGCAPVFAEPKIHYSPAGPGTSPQPAINDAAEKAHFTLLAGGRDQNGADLAVLHDGRKAPGPDAPQAAFFFDLKTQTGSFRIDLGSGRKLREISPWSCHSGERAPQVYQVFSAEGSEKNFQAAPAEGSDPAAQGWQLLGKVDTRAEYGSKGGGYAVTVPVDSPAAFRYLFFQVSRTGDDRFGQTFFNEVDVISADGPPLEYASEPKRILKSFATADDRYRFTIDATEAPALMAWAEEKLVPVVLEWYPRTVELLPSADYKAPSVVLLEFKNDMKGTPAYAMGNRISLNAPWFEKEKAGEARGCVVHEMVHVVQNYWQARQTNPRPSPNPGWIVEGIPDYIRWFLYEPESRGAAISARAWPAAKYNDSYRVSANFIDWAILTHGKSLLAELNAACREGRYADSFWKQATGRSMDELGQDWRAANARRLGLAP